MPIGGPLSEIFVSVTPANFTLAEKFPRGFLNISGTSACLSYSAMWAAKSIKENGTLGDTITPLSLQSLECVLELLQHISLLEMINNSPRRKNYLMQ